MGLGRYLVFIAYGILYNKYCIIGVSLISVKPRVVDICSPDLPSDKNFL